MSRFSGPRVGSYEEKGSHDKKQISLDTRRLRAILEETQCPLIPAKYQEDIAPCAAYYFGGEMWRKDGKDSCCIIHFADDEAKHNAMYQVHIIFAIDKYLSKVDINQSVEMNHKMINAHKEATSNFDDGDTSNDILQILIPTVFDRCFFLGMVGMVILNIFFSFNQIHRGMIHHYHSAFLNNASVMVSICELLLYADGLLSTILVNLLSMIRQWYRGCTFYEETKNIGTEFRYLSALSIMRFTPSPELVYKNLVNWKWTLAELYLKTIRLCQSDPNASPLNTNWISRFFSLPVYLVTLIAPFISFLGVIVKIVNLDFIIFDDQDNGMQSWSWKQYLTLCAFMIQISGMTVFDEERSDAIQHFIFSGKDCNLEYHEREYLDQWWNVCMLSVLSNLGCCSFDNMVFWGCITPQKTELLFKRHSLDDSDAMRYVRQSRNDWNPQSDPGLKRYDRKVHSMLIDPEYKISKTTKPSEDPATGFKMCDPTVVVKQIGKGKDLIVSNVTSIPQLEHQDPTAIEEAQSRVSWNYVFGCHALVALLGILFIGCIVVFFVFKVEIGKGVSSKPEARNLLESASSNMSFFHAFILVVILSLTVSIQSIFMYFR